MIQPKDFQPMQNIMKGFGYTFSNQGIDADVNGFPDFAVGAPFEKTGSAVLLRTIPVFKFDVKANVTYQLSKPTNETNNSKNCSIKFFSNTLFIALYFLPLHQENNYIFF